MMTWMAREVVVVAAIAGVVEIEGHGKAAKVARVVDFGGR